MSDIFQKLREKASRDEARREAEGKADAPDPEVELHRQVAELTGLSPEEVGYCCGSICPHCESFLDKAIGLVELGRPHHLFLNPVQQERFDEALALFRDDRKAYDLRKKELIASLR